MSNIFSSMAKYFGPKEHNYTPEFDQTRLQEAKSNTIVLGYTVVCFNTKSQSRVNNFDNL
jgi:hypothetical protein